MHKRSEVEEDKNILELLMTISSATKDELLLQ